MRTVALILACAVIGVGVGLLLDAAVSDASLLDVVLLAIPGAAIVLMTLHLVGRRSQGKQGSSASADAGLWVDQVKNPERDPSSHTSDFQIRP